MYIRYGYIFIILLEQVMSKCLRCLRSLFDCLKSNTYTDKQVDNQNNPQVYKKKETEQNIADIKDRLYSRPNKSQGQMLAETNDTQIRSNLRILIDSEWATCVRINFRDRIRKALMKYILQKKPLLDLLRNSYKNISRMIISKRLVINLNLQEMINDSSNKSSMTLSSLLSGQSLDFQKDSFYYNLQYIQKTLLNQYTALIPNQHQRQKYFKQLHQNLTQIQRCFEQSKKAEKKDEKVGQILTNFLVDQIIKQYLLGVRYILGEYQVIDQSQVYGDLKQKWIQLQKDCEQAGSLQQLQNKFKQFFIVNAKCLNQEQKKNHIFQYPNQCQRDESQRSINKSPNSQSSNMAGQLLNENGQKQELAGYIKFYDSIIIPRGAYFSNIRDLKYIQLRNQQYLKDKFLALLRENEINIIRRLSQENLQFIGKTQIIQDKNPSAEPLIIQQPIHIKKVFEFISQKGDKDYSTLYAKDRKQKNKISRQTIWSYRKKQVIYSFLISIVCSIQELQRCFIHQTDFQYQNFIKFACIFLAIDFDKAFFVKGVGKNKQYFDLNRQMFKCWLNGDVIDHFCTLIATCRDYETIKAEYLNYLKNNKNNKNNKQQEAINRCMDLMEDHMLRNHKNQFRHLSHHLLHDQALLFQGFPLSKQEMQDIRAILPQTQDDVHFRYEVFLERLIEVYQNHNPNISSNNYFRYINNVSANFIRHQFSLASCFLSYISSSDHKIFREKMFQTISLMKEKPFKYICEYQQQKLEYEDELVISTLNNSHHISVNIFQNTRYVIHFLKSLIELIKQLQSRGFLLLYADINSFSQLGQRFILNNLTFLLKTSLKEPAEEVNDQLIELSFMTFRQLFLTHNHNLRPQIFFEEFEQLVKNQLFNYQAHSRIEGGLVGPTHNNLKAFFAKYTEYIHFKLFQRLMKLIISQYSKKDQIVSKVSKLLESKNQKNYFSLIDEIPEPIDQSY